MAKKQQKEVYEQTGKDQTVNDKSYDSLSAQNQRTLPVETKDGSLGAAPEVYGGYRDMAATGGVDPAAKNRLLSGSYANGMAGIGGSSSGGGSGGGGGAAPIRTDHYSGIKALDSSQYNEADSAFNKIDKTTASRFADTGGLDAGAMDRMTGMGGYKEFADTGGYSEADKANLRAKGLSPVSAFASTMRDDMSTRRAVQGGYAPGFDDASRALKRDTSRNITDASLNTELGIKKDVNAGKQWGISGGATAEQNAQSLKTANQLEGSRQQAQIETDVASGKLSVAAGRARIAESQQQTDLAIATGRTNKDIAEMQAAAAAGNAAAARELAKAELAAQNERYVMGLEQSGKLAGLGGMDSITQSGLNRGLDITNSRANADLGFGSLRTDQAGRIGGGMDAAKDVVGMASGLIGSFTGGGGYQRNPQAASPQYGGITGIGGQNGNVGRPPSYTAYSQGGPAAQGWF